METIFHKFGSLVIGALISLGVLHPAPAPVVATPSPVVAENLQAGAFNVSGGGTYRLKSSMGTTDTSIQLSSFKEPVSNTPYTMSYLGSTVAYITIEPQTPTRTEFASFTGITQNSDGSAALTGVTRGLTRSPAGSLCTASTTLATRHPGQSIVVLSDSPCLFAEYAVKRNDESISGSWTFGTPTAGGNPATKTYVDGLVNGGTVSTDAVKVAATAGETFNAGAVVYLNTSDGRWYKAKADSATTAENVLLGIAQGAGVAAQGISGGVIVHGLDSATQGSTLTPGQTLFISSATGGATSTAPGTLYRAVGISRTASSFYFDPYFVVSTTTNATTTNLFVSGSCDGCSKSYTTDFTTSGLWRKPVNALGVSQVQRVMVIAVGAGGNGGNGTAGTGDVAGAGGGGGAVNIKIFDANKLGSTVWVQVGTTTATSSTSGVSGGNGTPSHFGTSTTNSYVFAGGGGGGVAGRNGAFGGAGGSWYGFNTNATGSPMSASTTAFSGAGVEGGLIGRPSEWGGGSGGSNASSTALSVGGCSLFGGGGGGGGGPAGLGGGDGGSTGCYGTGGGGIGGTAAGNAGAYGSSATSTGLSTYAGTGGGGGGSLSSAGTAGTGGTGGYPGGGGGGGGGSDSGAQATGGRGAPGWVRVISW